MRPVLILAALSALACATPVLANKTAEAQSAFALADDKKALALFGEAIAESAGDPSAQALAYFGRGEIMAVNRRYDEALADFTAALALKEDDATRATTLISRAEVYNRKLMNAEAIADYTEGLRLAPGTVGAHYARGTIYRRMERKDLALADFDAELKINPTSYRALTTRADMLGLPLPKTGARGFEEAHMAPQPK